jgi:hypothetical protein
MDIATINIDRDEARRRVEAFTARRRRALTEMDKVLYRGYKALAEGLAVIDVNDAIKRGGQFDSNHCPKLALARADLETIFFEHTMTYENDSQRGEMQGRFSAWPEWDAERYPVCKALREMDEAKQIGVHRASINQGLMIDLAPGTLARPEEKALGARRWFKQTYADTVPLVPFHLRPAEDIPHISCCGKLKHGANFIEHHARLVIRCS